MGCRWDVDEMWVAGKRQRKGKTSTTSLAGGQARDPEDPFFKPSEIPCKTRRRLVGYFMGRLYIPRDCKDEREHHYARAQYSAASGFPEWLLHPARILLSRSAFWTVVIRCPPPIV